MRDQREVQHAHDVLHAVIAGEVDLGLSPEFLDIAHAVHDVLSWVLVGPCGDTFSKGLNGLRFALKEAGYIEVKLQ